MGRFRVGAGQWQLAKLVGHDHREHPTFRSKAGEQFFVNSGSCPIRLTVNGEAAELEPRPDESLLEVLRDHFGIRSLKNGCRPQGQCGGCLALVDDRAVVTCAMPARKADGREVVTIEGLPEAERDLIARAFAATSAVQCGFCMPAIALRAKHLLDRNPRPERAYTLPTSGARS